MQCGQQVREAWSTGAENVVNRCGKRGQQVRKTWSTGASLARCRQCFQYVAGYARSSRSPRSSRKGEREELGSALSLTATRFPAFHSDCQNYLVYRGAFIGRAAAVPSGSTSSAVAGTDTAASFTAPGGRRLYRLQRGDCRPRRWNTPGLSKWIWNPLDGDEMG